MSETVELISAPQSLRDHHHIEFKVEIAMGRANCGTYLEDLGWMEMHFNVDKGQIGLHFNFQ